MLMSHFMYVNVSKWNDRESIDWGYGAILIILIPGELNGK